MRYRLSHFYAICTVFLWASAYVFTKVALNYFTAFSLGFLRYFVASIVLIIAASIKKTGLPDFNDIPKFILSGLLGFTLYMIAFNIGSKSLSSTTSSIIIATVPILTALFASVSLKEKLRALSWVAILIEFSGILVLTLWNGILSINIGVLWMFGAALLLSGYNITQRQYTKIYGFSINYIQHSCRFYFFVCFFTGSDFTNYSGTFESDFCCNIFRYLPQCYRIYMLV